MKRILMFTPFSARNGAEMMLLYIIKNFDRTKIEVALFSFKEGDLLTDMPEDVKFYTPNQITRKRVAKVRLNKILGKPVVPFLDEDILSVHDSFKPDFWYINTILCSDAVSIAQKHSIPFVIHFHELLLLYQHVSFEQLKTMIYGAKLLIGCSKKVCTYLEVMGAKNVALQYECVALNDIKINTDNVKKIRSQFNNADSYTWVMSGSLEYRKGADMIPHIASYFGNRINIVWLGFGSSGYSFFLEQEIKYLGLKNVYFLGGKSDDYYDYLSIADGLMLTSREDPFPLVMIEAGYLGKPIVGFNSGGVDEFVTDGTGIVVPNNNVDAFIKAMELVMNDRIKFDRFKAVNRASEFEATKQVLHLQTILSEI